MGYVPQRSIATTVKSTSVPTGRKRREDLRAGTTFGQNGTQKSQVKFKPCEISEKTTLFVLLSIPMNEQLVLLQKQFMPEDTKVGVIQAFLDDFDGDMVCSKLLHHEALGRFDEPKSWEIREINEIMNQSVTGWIPYPNPRSYKKYGKQRGWMRGNEAVETGTSPLDGFRELTEEECNQMELPF